MRITGAIHKNICDNPYPVLCLTLRSCFPRSSLTAGTSLNICLYNYTAKVFALRCLILYSKLVLGQAVYLLSEVNRCLLLRGSKCTINFMISIGVTEFVHCMEAVCFSKSPLLDVSLLHYYYIYPYISDIAL